MSSFNATANSGGGAFGSGNSAGQSGKGSIFGSGTSNKSAGNIFGGTSNPASSSGGAGLFGNTAGLFGGGSNTSPAIGSSIFGGNPSADKVIGGSSLGGGLNTPSSTSGTSGALFGGPKTAGSGVFGSSNAPTTSAPASGPNGGSLFGNIGAAGSILNNTKPPSTGTNPLFGSSSAFSLPKAGESATGRPATSNFFAQPLSSTSGATTSGSTTSAGSGLFNLPQKPADASTTSSAGVANPSVANISSTSGMGGGLFGSGGLFAKTALTPSATTAGNTASEKKDVSGTSNTLGGGLFGSSGTAKKDESKKDGIPAAPPTSTLFGSSAKPDEKQSAFSLSTAAKIGEKKDALAVASTTVAITPPSMLRGKTLEEIVNRWTSNLETNIREFNKFGAEVAVWDRALIENGNNIAALYSHVLAAEQQQNEINEALDHIEQQQKDLASTLDAYEKVSHEIPGMQGGTMRSLDTGPADNERDKNYMLATDLHTHLDDLSGSMTQLIESVNTLSVSSKLDDSSNDPMSQITRILSSHLESLQWIDTAVREVENKASEVDKRIKESGHSLSGSGLKSRVFGLNR